MYFYSWRSKILLFHESVSQNYIQSANYFWNTWFIPLFSTVILTLFNDTNQNTRIITTHQLLINNTAWTFFPISPKHKETITEPMKSSNLPLKQTYRSNFLVEQ